MRTSSKIVSVGAAVALLVATWYLLASRLQFGNVWFSRYLPVEAVVLATLTSFVFLMCYISKKFIWPGDPLHPSFVGSLVSASGTIFAASIAWTIADYNLETQRARDAIEMQRRNEEGLRTTFRSSVKDLAALMEINRITEKFLGNFSKQDTNRDIAARLQTLTIPAIPSVSFSDFIPPTALIDDIAHAFAELAEQKKHLADVNQTNLLRIEPIPTIESQTAATIGTLRKLHDDANMEIDRRTKSIVTEVFSDFKE
jgi:hypothetical protein